MREFITRQTITALLLIFLPFAAGAQSMTVIGGDSYARECFMAATFAAQMNSASNRDAETCTLAIEHGHLSMQDLMATFVNRGIVYAALEEYQKAVRDYAAAVKMNPQTGEVYVNRGNLYFLSAVFDKAIEEYTLALNLGLTKDHVAHYNRGLAYEKVGDLANAEADYRRAIEIKPEWSQPQAKLDRLQRQAKQPPSGR